MSFVCVKKIQKFIKQIEMNHVCVNPIQLFIRQTTWSILGNPFTLFFFFFFFFLTTCLSLSLSLFERERERGVGNQCDFYFIFLFFGQTKVSKPLPLSDYSLRYMQSSRPTRTRLLWREISWRCSKMLARDFESKISWDLKNH